MCHHIDNLKLKEGIKQGVDLALSVFYTSCGQVIQKIISGFKVISVAAIHNNCSNYFKTNF